jgi:hypothetical protein
MGKGSLSCASTRYSVSYLYRYLRYTAETMLHGDLRAIYQSLNKRVNNRDNNKDNTVAIYTTTIMMIIIIDLIESISIRRRSLGRDPPSLNLSLYKRVLL